MMRSMRTTPLLRPAFFVTALAIIAVAPAARGQDDDSAPADAPAPQDSPVVVEGDSYADTDPGALTDFRSTLDPHGAWSDDPSYGTVWMPSSAEVGSDFQPYVSAGHWAYDDDYNWVSDYEWGWATFHYGRWALTSRGWAWIPGREYAGAWVVWQVGDGDFAYVGWAAMAPTWGWRDGVAGGLGFTPRAPFVFCRSSDLFSPGITGRLVGPDRAPAVAAQTHPYNAPAPPRVAARPFVQPVPHGPGPSLLGIAPSQVARLARADGASMRARQYARPSTAQALGAHPPTAHVVHASIVPRPAAFPRPAARSSSARRK